MHRLDGVASGQAAPDDPRTLSDLLTYIAARQQAHAAGQVPEDGDGPDPTAAPRSMASGVDPALVDYFRRVWSSVGARHLLRQSQARVPTNAGPLNSQSLVHRSLMMMRELSPDYLEHFLSYVDALSWMEQLSDGRPAGKGAVQGQRSRRARN